MNSEYIRSALSELEYREREHFKELARRHFLYFVKWMNPNYEFAWHNKLIIKKMDAFAKGKIKRLMISMPPRHGKTELGSRLLPAFAFGLNPKSNIIATSYAADLSQRNNRDVQRIIDTERFRELFPDVCLNSSNVRNFAKGSFIRTTDMFEIVNHKGSYRSTGIGGSLTGMGADFGIIDDPHKDMAEAMSPTIKQGVEEWYQSTFYTRLTENGQILLIQTRWAEDDLAGRLLKRMSMGDDEYADKWEVLSLPAISDGDEIIEDPRLEEDIPLWPQKFDLPRLLKIKSAVGSKVWSSLYQQRPAPSEGNTINIGWFKKYKSLPELDYVFDSWDFTFKGSKSSDYVVGQLWGVKGANKYLINQVREKASFTRALQMMLEFKSRYPEIRETVVEEKANGAAIIDTLREKIPGIIPYNPKESKEARAASIAPQIEAGNILIPDPDYFPEKASWIYDYLEEWRYFPYGKNDDQVDCTTQAILRTNVSINGWLSVLNSEPDKTEASKNELISKLFGIDVDSGSGIGGGGFGLGF